jgi:hypothetical protein
VVRAASDLNLGAIVQRVDLVRGALEESGVAKVDKKTGRLRMSKIGVAKATIRPTSTLRRAVQGAGFGDRALGFARQRAVGRTGSPMSDPAPRSSRPPRQVIPTNVLDQLASYGSAILGRRTGRPEGSAFGREFVGPVVLALQGPDRDRAIQELYDAAAAAADPLEVVGAFFLLADWDPASKDERFLALQDVFLDYMRDRRYSSGHLTRYEADRWIALHGDLRSSFDRLVAVDVPMQTQVPAVVELDAGSSKALALTGPLPEGNAFFAERRLDGIYVVFSERQRSSHDPTRVRCEEDYLGSFSGMPDLLRAVGQMLGTRPYWADADLEPYFPTRRT